jgi:hypothetical protein
MARAVVRALAVNAARGQLRSQQVFTKLLTETERARKALSDHMFDVAFVYKLKWEQELERRKTYGQPDKTLIDVRPRAGQAMPTIGQTSSRSRCQPEAASGRGASQIRRP